MQNNHQLKIALVEPQIPQNTGNIARLCAATHTTLDIVGPIGFSLEDKHLKRAGLDYWPEVNWHSHCSTATYMNTLNPDQVILLSSKATKPYTQFTFHPNSIIILGSETTGLNETYRTQFKDRLALIPMSNPNIRCLNLSNATAIVLYEALRQINATT